MEAEITARIPGIDPIISDYSAGYLVHASKAPLPDADASGPTPLDEAVAAVTALLLSASGDLSPSKQGDIQQFVQRLASGLAGTDGVGGERRQASLAARRLDQAIQVGSQRTMSSTLGLAGAGVDVESTTGRKVESRVDRKKLEKAERKIQAKQERKVMKNVEYEGSRLLNKQPDQAQSYEEFFMAVNPLQLKSDPQGGSKSKDIKVDSFDLSIGGKRILTDTSLTLAYGRKYFLTGANGVGKSTLLRALSRRELAIPVHITILHVEQEVRLAPHPLFL
jgi:ATP-binding cassette subfamily F protein 3